MNSVWHEMVKQISSTEKYERKKKPEKIKNSPPDFWFMGNAEELDIYIISEFVLFLIKPNYALWLHWKKGMGPFISTGIAKIQFSTKKYMKRKETRLTQLKLLNIVKMHY